jgi:hypothetical protein
MNQPFIEYVREQRGYNQWASVPIRKHSPEVDFGCWWKKGPRAGNRLYDQWRVSWIEATGELYALDLAHRQMERFILIGHFPTREMVEAAMQGWAESEMHLPDWIATLRKRVAQRQRGQPGGFESLFRPMPEGKYRGGFIEVGEFDGSHYAFETHVELLRAPDGSVWAHVCDSVDELPDAEV